MLRLWLLVLLVALNAAAITVPTNPDEPDSTQSPKEDSQQASSQNEQTTVDSYQPQYDDQAALTTEEDTNKGGIETPVRYLLPPREDAELHSFHSRPNAEKSDWTPMVQGLSQVNNRPTLEDSSGTVKHLYDQTDLLGEPNLPKETIRYKSKETAPESQTSIPIEIPSKYFQPPLPDSFPIVFDRAIPATELRPPLFRSQPAFRLTENLKPAMPTISLDMQPPKPPQRKYRNPTYLYPKKYSKLANYKPIPIPMKEYHEGDILQVPNAKPVKLFKPQLSEADYEELVQDEKKILKHELAEEKRQFQNEENAKMQQEYVDSAVEEAFGSPHITNEQEASETGFYGNGQDSYAAALPAQAPVSADEPPAPAERTEFRMHGLQGPNSYKFGYDTGKGKNRQFRFEERNNDGYVKGHYGYVDRHGKTQVVNYDAHPEHGFHAEGPFGKA